MFWGKKEKVQVVPWVKEWGWLLDSEKQSSNKKQQNKAPLAGKKKAR